MHGTLKKILSLFLPSTASTKVNDCLKDLKVSDEWRNQRLYEEGTKDAGRKNK